ncbi:MAG: response regulator transcription factor [Acidimicrobiales bacterium]
MANSPPDARRTSVLVADDDARFRSVLVAVLEGDGYLVVAEAVDAQSTLLQDQLHHPDIVVLDLVMPGSDGLSTAEALLATEPRRPVVVISSLFDPVVEQEAVRLGAWYIEKAEGVEALEHTLASAVGVSHRPG